MFKDSRIIRPGRPSRPRRAASSARPAPVPAPPSLPVVPAPRAHPVSVPLIPVHAPPCPARACAHLPVCGACESPAHIHLTRTMHAWCNTHVGREQDARPAPRTTSNLTKMPRLTACARASHCVKTGQGVPSPHGGNHAQRLPYREDGTRGIRPAGNTGLGCGKQDQQPYACRAAVAPPCPRANSQTDTRTSPPGAALHAYGCWSQARTHVGAHAGRTVGFRGAAPAGTIPAGETMTTAWSPRGCA